ncbi:hypothetical protein [Sphingomonas sp.]|jgi:hypothetical protein|uniref:hypothetical protein n=1 Tax=Sphingomonas sp. TaxID=28214 RepID=UPI002FC6A347
MSGIREIVRAELTEPVDPRVAELAAAVAATYPGAARAVLFYGSCLRERKLDGLMLDFYLIVSSYAAAYPRTWLAAANRLIPPNVFPFADNGLSAKYAVLSEADFARECSAAARSVSVYARFAQPARLAWAADDAARASAVAAVACAPQTLLALARAAMTDEEASDPLAIWRRGFAFTYGAELRAERSSRSDAIVAADPDRYRGLAAAAGFEPGPGNGAPDSKVRAKAALYWRRMQRKGKALSVLRLAKASFTFAGGIDYLAWKINRHAGTDIVIAPWQRRWPLLGALTLLPRLLSRGAIR